MAEGEVGGERIGMKLEYTPTWIVTVVCSIIVIISLFFERILHRLGKKLKKKNQNALYDALLKVKEELMLLGFVSLLLVVFQGAITKICIPESFSRHMLPCKLPEPVATTAHYRSEFFAGALGGGRRLLSSSENTSDHCAKEGKVPLLSLEAIHQLHIFIFVLAVTHVILSAATMLLGTLKIRQWRQWENSIQKDIMETGANNFKYVNQFEFIKDHYKGVGTDWKIWSWFHSFLKQFYGAVNKSDYTTMRLGFIMAHCRGNPKFNFHKYMIRALEADFKRVVGLSWYLWIFVMIYLLLNVHGWHAYFWLSFVPIVILLAVGTKLEHVITQLAYDVVEKHSVIEGNLVINPSDDHFWFHRPRLLLYLIHFILFQTAFEIAAFFWILTTYGFDSCIMGEYGYIIPRLTVSVLVQLMTSYSTLPLYAIVTQMGSSMKGVIFEDHVREGLVGWAKKARKGVLHHPRNEDRTIHNEGSTNKASRRIQVQEIAQNDSMMEEGRATLSVDR